MNRGKTNRGREGPSKPKVPRARCKQVLVILDNRIETVDLVREEEYEPGGDFPADPIGIAVVRFRELEVHVSLNTVVFLK